MKRSLWLCMIWWKSKTNISNEKVLMILFGLMKRSDWHFWWKGADDSVWSDEKVRLTFLYCQMQRPLQFYTVWWKGMCICVQSDEDVLAALYSLVKGPCISIQFDENITCLQSNEKILTFLYSWWKRSLHILLKKLI